MRRQNCLFNLIKTLPIQIQKDSDMSLQDKAKAAAKNVEGKVQETAGDLTDNHEAKAKGKAKQAEAKVSQKVEDVKDGAKKIID
jgi:uncharacterized protein YjbJ (UPF0337 family)